MSRPIFLVAGARPNFVKLAPLYLELTKKMNNIQIVHTGQHYDHQMSQIFFDELSIPPPDHFLGVGSDTHSRQTAKIMISFEDLCIDKKPSVYNRLMRKIHYDSQQFIECIYGLTSRTDTSFWSHMTNREKYTEQFWRNHDSRKNANLNVFPRDIYKQLIPYFHLG